MNTIELWNRNYSLVKDYYRRYRNTNIPKDYVVDGYKIGVWLNTQRNLYKKNKLLPHRRILLNKLNVDWFKSSTEALNTKEITNMKIYNELLDEKIYSLLTDLQLDGYNKITSKARQKHMERVLIKKIWR